MPISRTIEYAKLDDLFLDPLNPRLGRQNTGPNIDQDAVLDLIKSWTLEELAVSFLESGYWPQEAVIVVRQELYGADHLVVVEGNRRIAALKMLERVAQGRPYSKKWEALVGQTPIPQNLFDQVPYITADSRQEIEAFLGFRHVTGIKEWNPAEKAEYIAKLIEGSGMTYEQVMRKIGSKTPTVRQNYIAFRLLMQMEDEEDIATEYVEDKFSVLYLSLRSAGVQAYLSIDPKADPAAAKRPVPNGKTEALKYFSRWLFGTETKPPIVRESRQVDSFGRILASPEAVEYLERSETPSFDVAFRFAGGDEPELIRLIAGAADNLESALSRAHLYRDSRPMQKEARRLGIDAIQLMDVFPGLKNSLLLPTS